MAGTNRKRGAAMKRNALVFTGAFLLGFVVMASRDKTSASELSKVENASEPRASSSRLDDAFTEYEALIFDEEEKVQRLLEEANTLSSLLGLAEKLFAEGDYNRTGLRGVARKLAELYPVESLQYYREIPSDVRLNNIMLVSIEQAWASQDLDACLAFLVQDQALSLDDSCYLWIELVRYGNRTESIKIFAQLSEEKQNKIMKSSHIMGDYLLRAFLPVLKDEKLRSSFEAELKNAEETQASDKGDSEKQEKSPEQIELEKCNTMMAELKKHQYPPEKIVAMLRDIKSREKRESMLLVALERRMDDETADAWLMRVSEVLAVVDEIPDGPPSHSGKGVDPSREELQAWLPKQSTRLQWAWADNVVNQMHGEDAMQWIDKLSQASLRMDLRDQALESWATDSPAEAAEYMVEKASNTEQEDYLPTAVYRWALQDYAAAKQWIDAQADSPAKAAALKKLEPDY